VATVASLLADVPADAPPKPGAEAIPALAGSDGRRVVSYDDWIAIDQAEIGRGAPKGKPREKFTSVDEMLDLLGVSRR
jgi:ferredoxin--NADP+ reductase